MATTGRAASTDVDAGRIASRLREADFVHLVARSDGAGLAAIGLLADALDEVHIPHQVSLTMSPGAAESRFVDEGTTLALGFDVGELSVPGHSSDLSLTAFEIASEFDIDADPILAIAGALAGSDVPAGPAFHAAQELEMERRPGLGIPVEDLAAGLAYSGRFHAGFSGDEQTAGAFLAELDLPAELEGADRTRLASAVALDATESESSAAIDAVSGFLAPYEDPTSFETVEGYADILDALAMANPGLGLSFVLGYEDREAALEQWRDFGEELHLTVDQLSPAVEKTVAVAAVDSIDPRPVARLCRDFEVEVPVVIVGGSEISAVATTDEDAVSLLEASFDGTDVAGHEHLAWLHSAVPPETVAEELAVEP